MKKIINAFFDKIGLKVIKKKTFEELIYNKLNIKDINSNDSSLSMKSGVERIFNKDITNPATIIDVGAAQGNWSIMAMEFFPKADYILFEPLEERKEILNFLSKKYKNFHIVNKAAGDNEKKIDFYVTNDLDGSGIADNGTNAKKTVIELTTLDIEIEKQKLSPPYIIKLDTHGFEVPILEGASNILSKTYVVIIECYGYKIAPNSLLFWEMCQYMEKKGFRLIDIVDITLRPKDSTFWQCDAFFIPLNSECFKHNTYNF